MKMIFHSTPTMPDSQVRKEKKAKIITGIWLVALLVAFVFLIEPFVFEPGTLEAASAPEVTWNRTFGGSDYDSGISVQQTTDGGYIIAGETLSYGAGNYDFWLIKTNPAGNAVWNKTFGGLNYDRGRSGQQTSDGGYIITGWTYSYGAGMADVWLIKTDSSGNVAWNKTFGGSAYDDAWCVQQTSDGGYIITGQSYSYGDPGHRNIWLIKTDSLGNEIWNKAFNAIGYGVGHSVVQTSDGGYIIAAYTGSPPGAGAEDVLLIKTNPAGNAVWNKTFGGSDSDVGWGVQQTSDGGYIITGHTESYGAGGWDVWLIKTDSSGNEIWNKTFGGSNNDTSFSVQQTSDGGYIVAGHTDSYGAGALDSWLIKTDSSGNIMWDKTLGGSLEDRGRSVQQTSDGGYVIVGRTYSYGAGGADAWLLKLGPGSVGWETYAVDKIRLVLPWLALGVATIVGVSILALRRRRAQNRTL